MTLALGVGGTARAAAPATRAPAAPADGTASRSPAPSPTATAPMQVLVAPAVVDGELSARDREALTASLRRALASTSYELLDDCGTPTCREAAARAHRVELQLRTGEHSFALELIARRPGEREPFASTSANCDICGFAELQELLSTRADALRRRLEGDGPVPATLAVTSTPRGATVRIDGEVVGVTPLERAVTPGVHQVELSQSGYFIKRTRITAARGVHERVHTTLDPAPRVNTRRILGATAIGVGAAAMAGGIGLLAIDGREIPRRCDASQRDADGDCRWVHRTQAGGLALTIAGAALAATGLGVLLVHRRGPRGEYALRATLSPKRVTLTMRF
ncbi:MAG: PEGA domain-containing protein [Deltaproteobacteria bacterium]|nr:PEGA domain-containing protein [Deltaproteobacteria bacterium]MBK8717472.1 PEGA domain-containing protein [Deltaproteobacteria bacterium]